MKKFLLPVKTVIQLVVPIKSVAIMFVKTYLQMFVIAEIAEEIADLLREPLAVGEHA